MTSKEVSELTGVSVRTLQHYDKIGLLSPERNPENDYRIYSDADLNLLQQILLFRACGFPLEQIKRLISSPDFDHAKAFDLQEKYLLHESGRIQTMLKTLRKSRLAMKGEIAMNQKEKFEGFDFTQNPYEEEARALWGDEAVENSSRHLNSLSKDEQEKLSDSFTQILCRLAEFRSEDPASPKAQQAVGEYYRYLNGNFGHHYTPEAFAGLGQMYIADERFTKNIDRHGEGLSAFLAKAMTVYAESIKS